MQDDCITIALGMPEVRVVREEETEQEITVEVIYRAPSGACPWCGQETSKVHSVRCQRKRDRPFRSGRVGQAGVSGAAQEALPVPWVPEGVH